MGEATNWVGFFENFSYKPNFSFSLQDDVFYTEVHRLEVRMIVPNSRWEPKPWDTNQNRPMVPVTQLVVLDKWWDEDFAKCYVLDIIRSMEDHEINEWFKYKGELPFDPHEEK